MGFTVEAAAGRSLAIKAGKHNRTPVFVDLEQLLRAKGKKRIKVLKEEGDRAQLAAGAAKAVEAASSIAELRGARFDCRRARLAEEARGSRQHADPAADR